MPINTYGDIGNMTAGRYVRKLLEHTKPVLVLERFGSTRPMPRNETKLMQFRRSLPFAKAVIPLEEGVTPEGSDFGYEDVSVLLQQYGDWTEITDIVQDFNKDPVMMHILERQGEQIAETREALTWDVLRAGTSVRFGGTASQRTGIDHTSKISTALVRRVRTDLKRQKAKKFTSILDGSTKYESRDIEAAYIGITHTDVESDIRDLTNNYRTGFVPTSAYGSRKVISQYELGSFEEFRFITSPDLDPHEGGGATLSTAADRIVRHDSDNKTDVYPVLFLGRDAFACVPLRGRRSIKPAVLMPGKPRGGDYLGQRGSSGWKMYHACVITNQAWMMRAEVSATL